MRLVFQCFGEQGKKLLTVYRIKKLPGQAFRIFIHIQTQNSRSFIVKFHTVQIFDILIDIIHIPGEQGKKLLTVTPTFEMYDVYAKMFGMKHAAIEYKDDFSVDIEDILQAVDAETGIVILLNPNSPIGSTYDEAAVRKVVERAALVGAVVVIDEAYHYFYQPTYMPLIQEYDNLLIFRTFSKEFFSPLIP